VAPVTESTIELDGQPVFVRRAGEDGVPVLYLHGTPSSSDEWTGLLERTGGLAPDLPGFGRSGKRGDLDYTPAGHVRFLDRLLGALGVERVRLCVHEWGVVGLRWAIENPGRVERVVVVNGVPLLPGFAWRGPARLWRAPAAGEVAMGLMTSRPVLRRATRRAAGAPLPAPVLDAMHAHFDQGTQRALLRLYRAATPTALAGAGAGLGDIGAPALVLWGAADPDLPPRWGAAYAEALGAELVLVDGAGRWPWLTDPAAADRIAAFLEG
jgi:pimeloyl-ACP methyl ester carboxylesterase